MKLSGLKLSTASFLLLLSACTAGPDFVSPFESAQAEPPQDDPVWSDGWADPAASQEPAQLDRWWTRFGDPTLDRLVDEALASNPSLGEAAARVAEARALRDHVAGRERPAASVGGSVSERRQSENGPLPIDRIPGLDRDQTVFDLGFDASWELDLAGRTRRALEAADAHVEGNELERQAAHLRVVAEVARVYVALREGQRRLLALDSQLTSAERTRKLVELRVEAGEDPHLDLNRVDADLRLLQARLPTLRAELRASALALGVLTGRAPESGLPLLDQPPSDFDLAPFPLGARADLLRRRPDVRAAERRLAAATAEIGVATAELYPRLSIGARGGFESLDAGDLLESASVTWSLMPAISWRVFDGGRVRAEIRIAEARAEQAAHRFEAAVLDALSDAERALARYRGGLEALKPAETAVEAASRVVELERLRHEAGETPLLPLLDAERRLDESQAALADVRRTAAVELVALYKALGGGWEDLSPGPTAEPGESETRIAASDRPGPSPGPR